MLRDNATYIIWNHADGDVTARTGRAVLYGMFWSDALTGNIALRDGTSASGPRVAFISGSQGSAGSTYNFGEGIMLANGLFIDDAATAGEVVIWYAPI